MTVEENKDLLLKDLCARIPYKVICKFSMNGEEINEQLQIGGLNNFISGEINIQPYLRSMSNITEDEKKKIFSFCQDYEERDWDVHLRDVIGIEIASRFKDSYDLDFHFWNIDMRVFDYLNSIHIDYRGLIEIGLALEAPEGMYK